MEVIIFVFSTCCRNYLVFRAHPKSIATGDKFLALRTLLIRLIAMIILLSASNHIAAFRFSTLS